MLNCALQLVLLLAIATSQILGGVSCCCLGRSVATFDALHNTSTTAASTASLETKQSRQPACSKCVKRDRQKAHPTSLDATSPTCHDIVSDANDKCSCHQVEPNACSPKVSASPERSLTFFVCDSLLSQPADRSAHRIRKADAPCRIGRHSWQAIACIWTN